MYVSTSASRQQETSKSEQTLNIIDFPRMKISLLLFHYLYLSTILDSRTSRNITHHSISVKFLKSYFPVDRKSKIGFLIFKIFFAQQWNLQNKHIQFLFSGFPPRVNYCLRDVKLEFVISSSKDELEVKCNFLCEKSNSQDFTFKVIQYQMHTIKDYKEVLWFFF